MRRAPRQAGTGDRTSLSLPAEPAWVALARTAAIGLLQHRAGGAELGARLASVVADLAGAGLSGARNQDRLRVHFDVGTTSVIVTVELRRPGRWQPGGHFLESRTVSLDTDSTRSRRGTGRR
ncbi:MAG: hypothetical protein J4F44_01145 [Acidimicrobiia bacterium]|nr:hypothetical protein [Acidimicrobiia bacterium]